MRSRERQIIEAIGKKDCQGWLTCNKILTQVFIQHPQLPSSLAHEIKMNISSTNNLLTLLLIHSKVSYLSYTFKPRFQLLSTEKNHLSILQWIASQTLQTSQQTIQLVLQNWGSFIKQHVGKAKLQDLRFFLRLINRYLVQRERETAILVESISQLQQLQLEDDKYSLGFLYQTKEMTIMRLCCQILSQDSTTTGNLGLVFDDFLLDTEFKSVQKFVNMRSDQLLEMDHEQLLRVFKGLTLRSLSYPVLSFFKLLAGLLIQEEQFFKLRHLFEQWVLPHLARRAKCCRKPKTQSTVLSITSQLIVGFLHHCQLGKAGLNCLLANIPQIDNKVYRASWIALSSLVVSKEEALEGIFDSWLREHGERVDEDAKMALFKKYEVFELSTRSIRERRQPKMEVSDLKGITNNGNQCYIISVVQALFMTKRLEALLDKASSRFTHPNISCLKTLFQKLSSDSHYLPQVEELKAKGPQEFAGSQKQEDAQNYLIRLLQKLQKQFKSQGLLEDFKKIFQLQTEDSLECSHCPYKTESKQQEYVHTIPHTQQLSSEWMEDITDYQCPKCHQRQFRKISRLLPNSHILLVHINRFSVHKGNTKKELPTQPILRKFKDYELVGMLFHIGKKIQFGHYTYYSRVERSRWAEMNDGLVRQFQLEEENQPFELQMKAEKTPYILVYKRTKD